MVKNRNSSLWKRILILAVCALSCFRLAYFTINAEWISEEDGWHYYDESGTAQWPAQVVNYTTKTQYLFRINKQVLDENEDAALNEYVDPKQRPIPFSRMIYVADGLTDVPCMRLVREYGGKSIATYNPDSEHARKIAEKLIDERRANFMTKADYSEGSDMENTVKKIIDHMKADLALEEMDGVYR